MTPPTKDTTIKTTSLLVPMMSGVLEGFIIIVLLIIVLLITMHTKCQHEITDVP